MLSVVKFASIIAWSVSFVHEGSKFYLMWLQPAWSFYISLPDLFILNSLNVIVLEERVLGLYCIMLLTSLTLGTLVKCKSGYLCWNKYIG